MCKCEAEKEIVGFRPLFLSEIMKALSELETEVWDNRMQLDKIKMQNIITTIKSNLIQIDKEQDIITVDGLRYKRVMWNE